MRLKTFLQKQMSGRRLVDFSFRQEEPFEPPSPASLTFSLLRAALPETVFSDDEKRNACFAELLPILQKYTTEVEK
jgi:hypothetical protein